MSWQAGSRRDRRGRDATLLVLAFPLGNHSKVSPNILPRARRPPRPATSPQVGPAGLRVGRAALNPRTWRLGVLKQHRRRCWGHPRWVAWGNPGIPIPTGSPGHGDFLWLKWWQVLPFCALHEFHFALELPCLLGPVVCVDSPHDMALGPPPGTRGTWGRWQSWPVVSVLVAALAASVREGEGFSAEITRTAFPELGTCASTPRPGWGERGGSFGLPSERGVFSCSRRCCIPGRVCLKSLPPPSLPGEELLPLNWRMLQAPADEPEESCGKVKASGEAACSCRVSPQLAAASPACCGRCHLQDREWPCGREVRGLRGAAGLSPPPRFNLQRARPVLSPPGPGMLLQLGAGSGSGWAGRGDPGEGVTATPPAWGQPGWRRRSGG